MTEQIEIQPQESELTGEEIVEDLASRLVQELGRSCYLTRLCAYRGYSAKITAELQLEDFDSTTVNASVTVGNPDPGRPARRFEVEIPAALPSAVRERSGSLPPSLERLLDDQVPEKKAPEKKRFYAPRQPRQTTQGD